MRLQDYTHLQRMDCNTVLQYLTEYLKTFGLDTVHRRRNETTHVAHLIAIEGDEQVKVNEVFISGNLSLSLSLSMTLLGLHCLGVSFPRSPTKQFYLTSPSLLVILRHSWTNKEREKEMKKSKIEHFITRNNDKLQHNN